MKLWICLLVAGAAFVGLIGGRALAQSSSPGPLNEAIYFRDAFGRCLRMQTTLGQNGSLMVFKVSNEACVKREQAALDQRR